MIYALLILAAAVGVMLQIGALVGSLLRSAQCSCTRYAISPSCPKHWRRTS